MDSQNTYHPSDKSPFELLETINQHKKWISYYIFGLATISVLSILALTYVAKKPPIVIRIDKIGNTQAIENYSIESEAISDEDIKDFSKVFLQNYVGLRSDLVVAQFEKSLNMMTDDFSKFHLESMKNNKTVKTIQAANVRNDVTISNLSSDIAGDTIYVTVAGILNTRPLDDLNTTPQSKKLQATLVLVKIKRTPTHPYALILKDIKLTLNKEGEAIGNNLKEVIP